MVLPWFRLSWQPSASFQSTGCPLVSLLQSHNCLCPLCCFISFSVNTSFSYMLIAQPCRGFHLPLCAKLQCSICNACTAQEVAGIDCRNNIQVVVFKEHQGCLVSITPRPSVVLAGSFVSAPGGRVSTAAELESAAMARTMASCKKRLSGPNRRCVPVSRDALEGSPPRK